MTASVSIAQFLETVSHSGLLDARTLEAYLAKLRGRAAVPKSPAELAQRMMLDGLLTRFQAERLLAGKQRGFMICGRYKVLDSLGAGGMGAVYLCEHLVMRHRVALKVLPVKQARDAVALERFHREARAIAALSHPNVIRAFEMDHEGDLHFLVLEYVPGINLQDLVQARGPLDPGQAAHCILQAAQGLQHAHDAGLVHRDIKPANLLLDRSGTIKVLDLGLARFLNDEHDRLTQEFDSQSILGTADYLAPEQAVNSHAVDIRADIYSLGCTFYFLLTGRAPFQGKTITEKLAAHQMQTLPPLRWLRPEVPEGLTAVLERMTSKAPEQRYRVPAGVSEALRPWAHATLPLPLLGDLIGPQRTGTASLPPGEFAAAPRSNVSLNAERPTVDEYLMDAPSTEIHRSAAGEEARPQVPAAHRTAEPVATAIFVFQPPVSALRRHRLLLTLIGGALLAGVVALCLFLLLGRKTATEGPAPVATRDPEPRPKVPAKPSARERTEEERFHKLVAGLPPEKQIETVMARLKQLNPGYDGQVLDQTIENGQVLALRLSTFELGNLRPLRALAALEQLRLFTSEWKRRGKVTDFRPLLGLPLKVLDFSSMPIEDLSSLRGLPLTTLVASGGRFKDLTPLRDLPLTSLHVGWNRGIEDLAPLQGLQLEDLTVAGTTVRDLRPLRGMPLRRLHATNAPVSDLSPLKGMPLQSLHIQKTRVRDLTPTQGMPLRVLDCRETLVEDLSPLLQTPIVDLSCDFQPARDTKTLRAIKTLRRINGQAAAEFWKAVDAQGKK